MAPLLSYLAFVISLSTTVELATARHPSAGVRPDVYRRWLASQIIERSPVTPAQGSAKQPGKVQAAKAVAVAFQMEDDDFLASKPGEPLPGRLPDLLL